jgi:hypothetical protein
MIDKLRHSATRSVLLSRRDVLIVASRQLHLRPGRAGRLPGHAGRRAAGRDDEPGRADPSAGGNPVRAQRCRFSPRHLPGARRPRGNLSGLRGGKRAVASTSSATRSRPWPKSTRCAARGCGRLERTASSGQPLRDHQTDPGNGPSATIQDELASGWPISARITGCSWRPSASNSAPGSTWR